MPTAADLTEEELAELKALTRQADPAAAVRAATTEYFRYVRRMRLKELSGKVRMEENWLTLEAADLKGDRRAQRLGSD
jgi:hypothetical protein